MGKQLARWNGHPGMARAFLVGMALAIFALVSAASPARAEVAGSVESGLAMLAQQIAEKSKGAERTTIAVLPFPHADGSCSVLSTYIVDELILSLFSVPNSKLDIVERSQLEALISEMKIGEGGLLNPATTKQLANLSGVSALIIGTITVIGDTVRLNARLVATETGKTISAAAVTIPKTQALSDLLKQGMVSGRSCGTGGARSGASSTGTAANLPVAAAPAQVETDQSAQMLVSGIRGTVTTAGRSKDGRLLSIALMIENVSQTEMRLLLVGPRPVATDSNGADYEFQNFSGTGECSLLEANNLNWCLGQNAASSYSKLLPGSKTTLNFTFRSSTASNGDVISFSSTFALLTAKPPNAQPAATESANNDQSQQNSIWDISTIGLGIPNVRIAKLQ